MPGSPTQMLAALATKPKTAPASIGARGDSPEPVTPPEKSVPYNPLLAALPPLLVTSSEDKEVKSAPFNPLLAALPPLPANVSTTSSNFTCNPYTVFKNYTDSIARYFLDQGLTKISGEFAVLRGEFKKYRDNPHLTTADLDACVVMLKDPKYQTSLQLVGLDQQVNVVKALKSTITHPATIALTL